MTATATSPEGVPPPGEPQQSFDFKAYLNQSRERVEAALDQSMGPERPESSGMRGAIPCWLEESDYVRFCVWLPVSLWVVILHKPCPRLWRSK